MRWSERLKLTWQTFLQEAPALYLWFLLYILATAVVIILFVFSLVHNAPLDIPSGAFPHRAPMFPGPYAPLPGGNLPGNFAYGGPVPFGPFGLFGAGLPFLRDPTLMASYLGRLAWPFAGLVIISLLMSASLTAGTYHLTRKALEGLKPSFRDFKLQGTWRVIGWYILLFLAQLLVLALAVLVSLLFYRIKVLLAIFLVVYFIALAALVIYLVPWLATAKIYLLAHRDQGFGHTLRASFTFFRRHMAVLWGYIGTALLILVVLLLLNRISPLLNILVSLAVTPFNMILPMVWVLSLLKEEAGGSPTSYPEPLPSAPLPTSSAESESFRPDNPNVPRSGNPPQTPDPSAAVTTPPGSDTPNPADMPNVPDDPGTSNATDMPDTPHTPDHPIP
ncbi:hypothetical protein CEB3_c36640 [Peptococcaceae bacterium CEB3]|nr:hypothetical protein CEB3_c36640 [Peptococcaceae bacterium CEB3]